MAQIPTPQNGLQLHAEQAPPSNASQDFLTELPKGTLRYKFSSLQDLGKKLKAFAESLPDQGDRNPFLVFSSVPPHQFEKLLDERTPPAYKFHSLYNWTTGALVLETMPLPAHERAVQRFHDLILPKVQLMGLGDVLVCEGSGDLTYGNLTKSPDDCWGLINQPGRAFVPSLVLEVGLSESQNKLAIDARGMMEPQDSEIGIIITIKIHRESARVVIRKWETDPDQQRPVTRSSLRPVHITQEITISRAGNSTTSNGILQIPFEKTFLRPADPANPLEQDLTFTAQELEALAEFVWQRQGFMP